MSVIRGKLFTPIEMVTIIAFIGCEPWEWIYETDDYERISLAEMLEREGIEATK